jgi:hypothetical protein
MKTDPKLDAFEICLNNMQVGASLDRALEGYPQWAGELRAMLEVAQARRGRFDPVPKAVLASRARFLQAAAQRSRPSLNLFSFIPLHFGLVSVILLLVFLFGGATTIAASAQALPGDRLYPVKRLTEQGRLLLVQAPAERIELEQHFDRERLAEVEALAEQRRGAEVSFAGSLEAAGEGQWRVENMLVHLAPHGQIIGMLEPGTVVQVDGTLQPNGVVLARRIEAHPFEITGILQKASGSEWMVDGIIIRVDPQTHMAGLPGLGSQLKVQAVWLANGQLLARSVQVLSPGSQPLPAMTSSTPETGGASTTAEVESGDETAPVEMTETEGVRETAEPHETEDLLETEQPSGTEDDHSSGSSIEPSRTPKPEDHGDMSKTPEPAETHESEDHDDENRTPETAETHEPEHTDQPENDSSKSDHSG